MAELDGEKLRSLIRLIPPARALREDLEKSIHLEFYAGTGDLALRSLQGLQASVAVIVNDPYITALSPSIDQNAPDKEKVSVALLATGQLLAYLEGQTGLAGSGGGSRWNINIQSAPNIQLSDLAGISSETLNRLVDMVAKPTKGTVKPEE